jgi:dTDP-4-dehydrorhamnose 3,5-epimerase-like enzyme
MKKLIDLTTFIDERGSLTVVDNVLPFEIKRVFYIYGVDNSTRGNHRHHKTIQAAVCISGSCRIIIQSGPNLGKEFVELDSPSKCLIINPEDHHWMDNFTENCILLVFASEHYAPSDYIFEPYL